MCVSGKQCKCVCVCYSFSLLPCVCGYAFCSVYAQNPMIKKERCVGVCVCANFKKCVLLPQNKHEKGKCCVCVCACFASKYVFLIHKKSIPLRNRNRKICFLGNFVFFWRIKKAILTSKTHTFSQFLQKGGLCVCAAHTF